MKVLGAALSLVCFLAGEAADSGAEDEMSVDDAVKTIVDNLENIKKLEKMGGADFNPESKKKLADLKNKLAELGLQGATAQKTEKAEAPEKASPFPVGIGLLALIPLGVMVLFLARLFLNLQKVEKSKKDKSEKKRDGKKSK